MKHSGRLVAALIAIGLVLSGCGPDAPPSGTPTGSGSAPSTSAAETPTSTEAPAPAMPDLAGTEVLSVTATATATNGAVLAVSLTIFLPVTADSPEGQQLVAYLESVGSAGDLALHPDSLLQLSAIEAEGGAWPAGSGVLPALGPGTDDTVIGVPAGPVVGSRLSLTDAGRGWGVAVLTNADGTPSDVAAWADRFTYYGFFDGFAGASLTDCSIQLTPLGSGAAGVANWSQHNCYIGVGD